MEEDEMTYFRNYRPVSVLMRDIYKGRIISGNADWLQNQLP